MNWNDLDFVNMKRRLAAFEFSGALNSHQGDLSASRVAAPKHRQPEGDSDAGGAAQNLLHALEQTGFSSSEFPGSEALPYI